MFLVLIREILHYAKTMSIMQAVAHYTVAHTLSMYQTLW